MYIFQSISSFDVCISEYIILWCTYFRVYHPLMYIFQSISSFDEYISEYIILWCIYFRVYHLLMYVFQSISSFDKCISEYIQIANGAQHMYCNFLKPLITKYIFKREVLSYSFTQHFTLRISLLFRWTGWTYME